MNIAVKDGGMYNIILWGLGRRYIENINIIDYMEKMGVIHVAGLTSSDNCKEYRLDGYQVFAPERIKIIEHDYIIVMSDKYYDDIVKKAVSLGIERKRCIPYSVLQIPFFDFDKYVSLIYNPVSIITNNCWGGVVYNTLKLECMSPFKNLFVEDDDYLRLLRNLRYYLSIEPVFCEYDIEIHSHEQYPVLMLGDVKIHCNHDKFPETAIANWKRRVKKVKFENLLVEMYTDNEDNARDFLQLDQYEKLFCFSTFTIDDRRNIRLFPKADQELWEAVMDTARLSQPMILLQDLMLGDLVFRTSNHDDELGKMSVLNV